MVPLPLPFPKEELADLPLLEVSQPLLYPPAG